MFGTSNFEGHWIMETPGKAKKFDWSGSMLTKKNGKLNLAVNVNLNGKRRAMHLKNVAPLTLTKTARFKNFVRSLQSSGPPGTFSRKPRRTRTRNPRAAR
jgi:hypothetical protein